MTKTQKIVIAIISVIIIGIIYWNTRIQIEYYFLKKHVVFWSENVEIKPSDFKAEANLNSDSNESWFHGLYLKSTNLKDAEVKALFDQNKSWIKDTTDFKELMKMQKLRFDLYESFARKFNKEINKIKYRDDILYSDLEKIGTKIYAELLAVEDSIYKTDLPIEENIDYWRPKINRMLE
ncbi:hypothetical protein DFQ11_10315 [Winogradskyella epiphytica]|uniref:Uncharacterized protein n=1 Tax=Winogradskyella epiphytica TaxID=262005 RepID=A0A2V4XDY3_9FLAO|nr:hypothetical protein [Winogradskyella epiphytica]PYE80935.1 hypothetical protein DFQ11_10315 [Winogradskyella epiphytica]GGW65641.1 hypothetical protein GCM10008085_16790 [Winogradskyella epiphytica]